MACQLEECDREGSWDAIKMCLDHSVSLGACPESPPPLYLCGDCSSHITSQHSAITFTDMLLPMAQVSSTCENKVITLLSIRKEKTTLIRII